VPEIAVLGLDPGLRRTGYAVARVDASKRVITEVLEFGTLCTERQTEKAIRKTSDDLRRAEFHAVALQEIVRKNEIQIVSMEMSTTTPYTYPTFSFGVMLGIAASLGSPIIQVLPYELKKAVTGDSQGTKRAIVAWAMKITASSDLTWPTSSRSNKLGLKYEGRPVSAAAEHPADALAAIEAGLQTDQFRLAATLFENVNAATMA